MKIRLYIILAILVPALAGCHQEERIAPLQRSTVDRMNKEAFINRYRQPDSCIALSQMALQYIQDSIPQYIDGELRARNNLAFAYYQKSDRESASKMLDIVEQKVSQQGKSSQNGAIETVIAQLLRARLLQRDCRIADCYRLLYDIDRRHTLQHSRDNLLYNYAQSEYYIVSLVLNFHYREGRQADIRTLLNEVESRRDELKVDYAQDMALNYALAYGWQSAGESLLALDYCDRNYKILNLQPSTFCIYHYANTMQMEALALKSIPGMTSPDSVLELYDCARRAFFEYGDPYQMLGGTTSTARYALLIGDTSFAYTVLNEWRNMHGLWKPFSAPKMELGYFDVLLRSRMASNPDQARQWYEHHGELQECISQFEKEDFVLQQNLADSTRRARWITLTAIVLSIMFVILLTLTILLYYSIRRVKKEKEQLEKANRRDVERIANVETCLSVLRHDVAPFMSYLRNPDLDPNLRSEVTTQLVRTFDNIKNWTQLSIPKGLVFNVSRFPLQDVIDDVCTQVMHPHPGVSLITNPTDISIYGDRLLVSILIRNLVTNALQHTDHGHVDIQAELDEEKMAIIKIADTGVGMTPDEQESLFKADREIKGDHGFGLILCKYIIKKHDDMTRRGCRIWVESTLGEGTTVFIRLASTLLLD